ncbi:ABC transporter permease [Cytophagales bacterium WSM2-2]|nr:ABC transporter permease [Cytophagales bacterium WSM2-2]
MIKNYLLITFRNLLRNKAFSFINIVGLAFGISCSLIIFLWVNDELKMDAFHADKDRLYKIMENQTYSGGQIYTFSSTPGPMAPVLKERFPEIEMATRITWEETRLFQVGEKNFYEKGRFVDQDFTMMHSYPLIKGDSKTCLKDIHSIVISQKMAQKFFGDDDAMGKTFVMDAGESFTVTGILAEIPPTSSLKFDFLLPFEWYFNKNKNWLGQWGNNNIRTNILLTEKADWKLVDEKLRHEINNHTQDSKNTDLFITPLKDAYLYGKYENGKLTGGRIEQVRIFFGVGILVLVIASINFMNLTTARSTKRAKEVGLRKTVGAVKTQLTFQFMTESMMMVVFSAILAIGISYLMLPLFNDIAGKSISLDLLTGQPLIILVSVIFFTGIISGSYPALYISGFNPASVLKGQIKSGGNASMFRKILVVTQFSLSIILIISTLVVLRQLNFIRSKDIGLERNGVTYMWMKSDMRKHSEAIRQELLQDPAIESASLSSANPIDFGNSTSGLEWTGKDPKEKILFSNFSVDYNFIKTLGMQMKFGRSFKQEFTSDTANFIVNEAGAKAMGFEENAIDQPLTLWGNKKGKIIGVVKDFHFQSVHAKVDPLFMLYDSGWFNVIFVKYKPGQMTGAQAALEKINKRYAASYPFESHQLDQDWENLYKTEDRFGKLFNYFSVLSIIISCLGLFGLSAFSAEQRTKELGVRKVMGASVPGLMQLMAREFAWLVLIAALIGCPLGWYAMDWWLKSYAYHVEVGSFTLIVAAIICLAVSMLTVSYHSAKAAMVNPVRSLRYE